MEQAFSKTLGVTGEVLFLEAAESLSCKDHTLVSHVAVIHGDSALLVKYLNPETFDGQGGWFLPNDGLNHIEHPEAGARRILQEQLGLENLPLKLIEIESFTGNNKSWHLIFDYLATAPTKNSRKANSSEEPNGLSSTSSHPQKSSLTTDGDAESYSNTPRTETKPKHAYSTSTSRPQ